MKYYNREAPKQNKTKQKQRSNVLGSPDFLGTGQEIGFQTGISAVSNRNGHTLFLAFTKTIKAKGKTSK
jgi:hypothetical protein